MPLTFQSYLVSENIQILPWNVLPTSRCVQSWETEARGDSLLPIIRDWEVLWNAEFSVLKLSQSQESQDSRSPCLWLSMGLGTANQMLSPATCLWCKNTGPIGFLWILCGDSCDVCRLSLSPTHALGGVATLQTSTATLFGGPFPSWSFRTPFKIFFFFIKVIFWDEQLRI